MTNKTEDFIIKSVLPKIEKFCVYQERSNHEVHEKLKNMGIEPNVAQKVFTILTEKDFLNEKRYCELFIRSKINQNAWGPKKIVTELKKKKIDENTIESEFKKFPDEVFEEKLLSIFNSKLVTLKDAETEVKKQKLIRFAWAKGYPFRMCDKVIAELF